VRLLVHELRTEQLLFWRNREAAFFTFFLPVIFFLIFGSVYGGSTIKQELVDGRPMKASPFLEAGMIGYGVAATCFAGLAISLVVRRESGVLKRIRATPLPPAIYLLGVLGSTFVVFLIEAVLILAIGRLPFSVAVPNALPSLLVVLAIGALAVAGMGLGITALVRSSEGSSAVVNAVYLPMAIISGTFFTPKTYPGFLKAIAEVLPLTHYTKLTRDVMLRNEHFWSDSGAIAVVLAWGAIGLVGAVRGFRWQPRDA
jgi:ABC-2 type transport system permease protein